MHRKLQRDPAHLANPLADALGQHQMVPVAGRKVAPRLRDADDRLATAQFLQAQPEVQVTLHIERRHVDIVGIVEPGAAAQFPVGLRRSGHESS